MITVPSNDDQNILGASIARTPPQPNATCTVRPASRLFKYLRTGEWKVSVDGAMRALRLIIESLTVDTTTGELRPHLQSLEEATRLDERNTFNAREYFVHRRDARGRVSLRSFAECAQYLYVHRSGDGLNDPRSSTLSRSGGR